MDRTWTTALRAALAPALLGLGLLFAGPATAQSPQSMFDCEIQARQCEMAANEQTPGNDPCAAYARCQSRKQCEASRCVCKRTHGSADPALAQEAMAMCHALLSPHGPNACDRYVKACQDWGNQQHQKPKPQKPGGPTTTPAQPQPGTPAQPLPPDQQPRFR